MTAEQYMKSIRGKRVAFIGTGVSHNQLIDLFLSYGMEIIICDRKNRNEQKKRILDFEQRGAKLILGEDYLKNLSADVIFRSPGVYYNKPELQELIQQGKQLTSEMELFFELCPCPIYAVTGSDGKTTTTSLIAEMLRTDGKKVHLGGNIGAALLPLVLCSEILPEDRAIVELSSFQLISMKQSPHVAVITNVTPNHLDVHGDMEEYIDAKRNILRYQSHSDRAVLSADNEVTAAMVSQVKGKALQFSRQKEVLNGAYMDEQGNLFYAENGEKEPIVHSDEIKLVGIHNRENFLAALAACRFEVSAESIREVAKAFSGVPHRMEPIGTYGGVRWYNDSIATSPTRTNAGLSSFSEKLIVIAGGYDKHIPFEPLGPVICKTVKKLIVMGDTAEKIEKAVLEAGNETEQCPEIIKVSDLPDAVEKAKEAGKDGDIVILSPACASFDRYPNFEQRGQHFKDLVRNEDLEKWKFSGKVYEKCEK